MFRRRTAAATIVTAVGATLLYAAPSHAAGSASMPVADAYVRADQPFTNYGRRTNLVVRGSGTQTAISYLRFNVTGLTQPNFSAQLRLHVSDTLNGGGPAGQSVYQVPDSTWGEETINYHNRPPLGTPALATLGRVLRNQWYEVDVTSAIRGNGPVSFAITANSPRRRLLRQPRVREGHRPHPRRARDATAERGPGAPGRR